MNADEIYKRQVRDYLGDGLERQGRHTSTEDTAILWACMMAAHPPGSPARQAVRAKAVAARRQEMRRIAKVMQDLWGDEP